MKYQNLFEQLQETCAFIALEDDMAQIINALEKDLIEQEQTLPKQNVSGSCFWGHKWTRWQQYTQQIKTRLGEGIETRQKRYCLKCGKMQNEMV